MAINDCHRDLKGEGISFLELSKAHMYERDGVCAFYKASSILFIECSSLITHQHHEDSNSKETTWLIRLMLLRSVPPSTTAQHFYVFLLEQTESILASEHANVIGNGLLALIWTSLQICKGWMLNFAFQDAMAKGVDPMWAKSEGQGQTGPLVGSGDDEGLQESDWNNEKKCELLTLMS